MNVPNNNMPPQRQSPHPNPVGGMGGAPGMGGQGGQIRGPPPQGMPTGANMQPNQGPRPAMGNLFGDPLSGAGGQQRPPPQR